MSPDQIAALLRAELDGRRWGLPDAVWLVAIVVALLAMLAAGVKPLGQQIPHGMANNPMGVTAPAVPTLPTPPIPPVGAG